MQVNFKQVYAHAVESDASWAKDSPGACAKAYFESFISYLKNFTEEVSRFLIQIFILTNKIILQGEYAEAIDAFNDLISTRKIIVECDNSFTYCGCSVKSGAFEVRGTLVLELRILTPVHLDQLPSEKSWHQYLIHLRGVGCGP